MDINKKSKKILFVGIEEEKIKKHCMPILKLLKEKGYEIDIANSEREEIEYCDRQFSLSFNKSKIKAYKLLKEIIRENNYEFIQCYTLLGGILTRLAARN